MEHFETFLAFQRSHSEGHTPAIIHLPHPFSEYKVGDEVELLQFDPDDSEDDDDDDWDPFTLSSVNGYEITAITKKEKIQMAFNTREIKLRRVGATDNEEEEDSKIGEEMIGKGTPGNIPAADINPPLGDRVPSPMGSKKPRDDLPEFPVDNALPADRPHGLGVV